jgi:hypothetical protein
VIGLGTAGYISSAQLLSTTYGYSQNFTTQNASVSSLRFSTATACNAYISSLTIDQLTFGDGNGWADFGVLRALAISTFAVNTGILYATTISTTQIVGVSFLTQANLTSTVVGLGTSGYLSSATANLVSTANLATLVSTSYLATQLGSTVIGLGTVGYISSSQLLSTSLGLSQYMSSFIDPTELTSTVVGLGTQGFVSSLGLTYAVASTAQGLGTFGYTSTSQLLSTSLGLYQAILNSPTAIVQANLTSTIIGLGTAGYISTVVLGSLISTANLVNLVSTANLANLVSTANLVNLVSTANLATLVSTTYLATQLGSTVIGLGTAGYLSSIPSLGGFVSTANLANLVSTANLANLVSTTYLATQLGSTVIGLGTAGYLSTIVLTSVVSTANLANLISTANLVNLVSTANLANLVSTANLAGHISTANLANLVSTANLATFVSTSYLGTQLASTVIGLGTAGYLSTSSPFTGSTTFLSAAVINASTINLQNFTSVQGFVSSLTVNSLQIGNATGFFEMGDIITTSLSTIYINTGSLVAGISISTSQIFASSITGVPLVNPTQLTSTIIGLGTAGYLSTIVLTSLVSTANLANLVSTANLANLVSTANLANLVSTANLATLVSTTYLATQLGSTVIGLGTVGYISSSQLLSTSLGLSQYMSSFIDPTELTSTVVGLGTQGFVSSLGLTYAVASTAQGLGTFGYTSTSQLLSTSLGLYQAIQNAPTALVQANLTSTVIGLGTVGYLSTVTLGSLVSTANLATLVSTSYLATQLGSTVIGLGTAGYLSSIPALGGFVSTANLANHVSTANLANLVSTTYLSTQLGSTFAIFNVSSFSTFSLTGTTAFISSLTVNALFIGSNQGFVNMGDVIATSLSTLQIYAGGVFTTSNQAIIVSTQQLNVSSITGITFLSQTAITSTVIGLGTAGYISSVSIANVVSTANLATLVSTSYLATQLGSTVIGLGSAGYVSTIISSFYTLSTGSFITSSIVGNNASLRSLSTGFVTLSSLNFIDQVTQVTANVYEKNSLLYFNTLVFAGARTGPGQFLYPQ